MAANLKCEGCGTIVVIAASGSKLLKKGIYHCEDCWTKIKVCLKILEQTQKKKSPVEDLFGDYFGGKGFFK